MSISRDSNFKCIDFNEDLKLVYNRAKKLKGIITDNNSNTVVQNFQVPIEYVIGKDTNAIKDSIREFPISLFKYVEGTSIRVYFWNGDWRISTTSRLDANTSFWSKSSSFGSLFSDLVTSITGVPIEVFLMSLNKDRIYFFTLPTTGTNRIGTKYELNNFFLMGIQENDKLLYGKNLPKDEVNAWMYLEDIHVDSMESLETLLSKDNTENDSFLGYLFYPDMDSNNQVIKILTEQYFSRCRLRDNQSNLYFRYLELKKSQDDEQCLKLIDMYPEISFTKEIDMKLDKLCKFLHKMYINRYVYKEYIVLDRIYFNILKRIHTLYIEKRRPTTVYHIKDIIYENDPPVILSLIRKFSYSP